MTIPNCTTENVLYAEPRRGSTFFIPTLRRALARRMWGQGLGSVPEYDLSRGYARSLRGYAKSRRCSTTAARFSLKAIVRALEPLDLASAELQTRLRVMPSVREVERSSTRFSECRTPNSFESYAERERGRTKSSPI